MAQMHVSSIFYTFIIIISIVIDHAISIQSLPSQAIPTERSSYVKRTLGEADICHPFQTIRHSKTSIKLDRRWNSAVIVQPGHIFDHWVNRTTDLKCLFVMKASQSESIMGVIQTISFRQVGNECLDYVQFRRKRYSKPEQTKKFCGQYDARKAGYVNEYSTGMNDVDMEPKSYGDLDSEGEIETTIFVSKQSLHPDEPPLNITIVYTPYKDCGRARMDHSITLYRTLDWGDCVAEDYFCDGIQNCIDAICQDEKDCPIFNDGTGAKVTIAAFTTIFLSFIIFLMGLWLCRKHKKLCWSSDCAGPSSSSDRFASTDRESGNSTNQAVPSAPMLQVSVLSSAVDKDLPPSYDSLFPEQANPSAT